MCRFYGFRGSEPTSVEAHLIWDPNALLKQSQRDRRGMPNADGWGIGYYDGTAPVVERQDKAAYQDEHFAIIAQRVQSQTIIGHVREASVGSVCLANTHPFVWGYWMFAHNGTVTAFDVLASTLERETDADLLRQRHGVTDSELVFLWLLTRMRRQGLAPERRCANLPALLQLLGEALEELDRRCQSAHAEEPAKLNFLLTDGVVLLATRWRHTLAWTAHRGAHEVVAHGVPQELQAPANAYQAIIVASEPTSEEDWHEVPDFSIFAVDGALRTCTVSIGKRGS